jgi:hypothetical protein
MSRTIQQNLAAGSLGSLASDRQVVYLDTVQAYDKWAEASISSTLFLHAMMPFI